MIDVSVSLFSFQLAISQSMAFLRGLKKVRMRAAMFKLRHLAPLRQAVILVRSRV